MSVQDDLHAAVTALDAENADRDNKAGAVRDALVAVSSAVDGLKTAVDSLGGDPTDQASTDTPEAAPPNDPAPSLPTAVTQDVPQPDTYPEATPAA